MTAAMTVSAGVAIGAVIGICGFVTGWAAHHRAASAERDSWYAEGWDDAVHDGLAIPRRPGQRRPPDPYRATPGPGRRGTAT